MQKEFTFNQTEEQLFDKLKELRESVKDYQQMEKVLPEEEYRAWKEITRDALCLMRDMYPKLNIRRFDKNNYWKGKFNDIRQELLCDYRSFRFKKYIEAIDEFVQFIEANISREKTSSINFDHELFSPYFGENKRVRLQRTNNGRKVKYMTDCLDDDKRCKQFQRLLGDHLIAYPYAIGNIFEQLWKKASAVPRRKELENEMADLFKWIASTAKAKPRSLRIIPEWQNVGSFSEI
jgi:hypothetical protein